LAATFLRALDDFWFLGETVMSQDEEIKSQDSRKDFVQKNVDEEDDPG
jgi:hypothetical protein